ncbi:MAG: TerB family tellurite resistance protein [Xenococcus sp. MO_188.B8]|nr:TerB family tellurite resistance protein [Xenococcus sp. MO_188.B8]
MVESTASNKQKLFRLLIAAAWIDGEFQSEEREYLRKLASKRNLLDEPEIKSLLSSTKPIESEKCYQWLSEYLGAHPTRETYQSLFAEIAGVVYADGYIATEEAELLNQLQALEPHNINSRSVLDMIFGSIRKLMGQSY